MKTSIKFADIDALPIENLPKPKIYLLDFHSRSKADLKGAIKFISSDSEWDTGYLFSPLSDDQTNQWKDWKAEGLEDCEIGWGTIFATAPNGKQYQWKVEFWHDGDRSKEFWGGHFQTAKEVN
tara:strand:- start:42 stop:410 length:369 start_codon:yes stop_codon:yes gene_type:complete